MLASSTGTWSTAQAAGIAAGQDTFKANAGKLYGVPTPTPTVLLTSIGNSVSARVTWSANATIALGGPIGVSSMPLGGASQAAMGSPTYYQFIFVLDVSQSMGIGGTQAAMEALLANSQIQCAFACHDPNFERYKNGEDNLQVDRRALARQAGIKLKIDFVAEALRGFMLKVNSANTTSGYPNIYKVGIHTIGSDFKVAVPPTTDVASVVKVAKDLDIETARPYTPDFWYGYSLINDGLIASAAKITGIGDGSSQSARKTFVVLLTDGVQDFQRVGKGRRSNTLYSDGCDAIKARNATLITIAAPMPDFVGDSVAARKFLDPLKDQITPALKNCSSDPSRYYFHATDGKAIVKSVNSLFSNATFKLSLTN